MTKDVYETAFVHFIDLGANPFDWQHYFMQRHLDLLIVTIL